MDGRATVERIPIPARRFVTLDASNWPEHPEHGGPDSSILQDAIVRVLNLPPEDDPAHVRRTLEDEGAFEVTEIRRRPVETPESNGGLSETLTAHEALEAYFAEDPDREVLVERGRALLAEVVA